MSLSHSFCQDLIKGFAQTWSKGEEEEEEDEDTSAETEGPSSSFESTEGRTEDTQSDKPEELPEESTPEQTAEITEKPNSTSEEKPANGTTESNSSSQSATSKKVQYEILLTKEQQLSLFRRLSFSRSKQSIDRDPTPAGSTVSGEAGAKGEPPSGAPEEPEETTRSQKSVPFRSPRSGACTLL
ncbi:hypothetical protein JOQ06_022633 [Pogonophryne albipinna]|uniref:Uncharacterized protein n=1 Tax=Pogonophryne albipinna TaxID=1090488 RepID=A0AAD6A673_9TELE|nr:hypothetical protein JOQ06_022633 [Pogonophryne albipinna]